MQYLLIYRRDGTSTSVKWCTLESHPRWKVLHKGKMLYAWNDVHEQWSSGTLTSAGPRFCHPISHAQINLVVLSKCPVQTAFLLSVLCFEQRNASTYILKSDFFNLKKTVFHCYYLHSQAVFILQKLQAWFPAIAANRKDCLYILSVLLACSIALFCYLPWLEGLTVGRGSQKIPAPPLLPPLLSTAVSVCLRAEFSVVLWLGYWWQLVYVEARWPVSSWSLNLPHHTCMHGGEFKKCMVSSAWRGVAGTEQEASPGPLLPAWLGFPLWFLPCL